MSVIGSIFLSSDMPDTILDQTASTESAFCAGRKPKLSTFVVVC